MPGDWGPLAVAPRIWGDEVSVDGAIRVSDLCVFLDRQGHETLLVWPAATHWDPSLGHITYTNSDGSPQIFSDGNHLVFRGVISTRADGGQTNQEWVASIMWILPPATQCLRDNRLFVDEVQIP